MDTDTPGLDPLPTSQALQYFVQLRRLRYQHAILRMRMDNLGIQSSEGEADVPGTDPRSHVETVGRQVEELLQSAQSRLAEMLMRTVNYLAAAPQGPTGPPPASDRDLDRLNTRVLTKRDLTQPEGMRTCAVCLDTLNAGDTITRLPCRHVFCCGCIREWLGRHGTCPTCRAVVKDVATPAGSPDASDYDREEADPSWPPTAIVTTAAAAAAPPPVSASMGTQTRDVQTEAQSTPPQPSTRLLARSGSPVPPWVSSPTHASAGTQATTAEPHPIDRPALLARSGSPPPPWAAQSTHEQPAQVSQEPGRAAATALRREDVRSLRRSVPSNQTGHPREPQPHRRRTVPGRPAQRERPQAPRHQR
eukprot:Hpha_TRINITY_DN7736_c0_g1::TRINITY_DN7736_c0_g1_i1::g.85509::m.85509